MSIKVMTMVFDRYPVGGSERLLALAMADHARDDGTRIWPSLDELARKTLQSRSTVKRQIARMLLIGWLERVGDGTGRGKTNEYRISPAWIAGELLQATPPAAAVTGVDVVIHKGSNLNPFPEAEKGSIHDRKGFIHDRKGFTAVHPESSEPSRTVSPLPPGGGVAGFDEVFAEYPNKANRAKAMRRWMRIAPTEADRTAMLGAIRKQGKTSKWRRGYILEFANWLRNKCWTDDAGPVVLADWWQDSDGIMAKGEQLGMPFTLAALGNAYTDDQRTAHWRAYRSKVFAAAGDGPWSERRAA